VFAIARIARHYATTTKEKIESAKKGKIRGERERERVKKRRLEALAI